MSGLFEQIKLLYDQALYCNVISLMNLVFSLSEHNAGLLPGYTKFHVHVYYADAHFYLGKYRRAGTFNKKALQFRKCLLKSKGTGKLLFDRQKYLPSDVNIKYQEVNSLIVGSISNSMNLEWLDTWTKAHAYIHNREYTHAVNTLRSLDIVVLLRDNFNLLTIMGECNYYAGDDKNALLCMRLARVIEPDITKRVDMYAAVLYKMHHVKELERPIPAITSNNKCTCRIYVAIVYSLFAARKFSTANTLIAQALNLNPNDIEATILRDCLVGMHRLRENIASSSCKQLGYTTRDHLVDHEFWFLLVFLLSRVRFGSSGLWCGAPPQEFTFTLSNIPRLPQTVYRILY
ncbi:Anaphase-promoting complex subunit 7 [Trachymyrmex cornetzi]|uniref:Anaphase-promoting complex subunit 7 n=1 Tax=Trachymyrmex cornetzi TaxID=471704 RepID=A0A151J096_9HYME|nr:Anaphase-promoting complex subunit 7 [Trachymyrmex cornetzi]